MMLIINKEKRLSITALLSAGSSMSLELGRERQFVSCDSWEIIIGCFHSSENVRQANEIIWA